MTNEHDVDHEPNPLRGLERLEPDAGRAQEAVSRIRLALRHRTTQRRVNPWFLRIAACLVAGVVLWAATLTQSINAKRAPTNEELVERLRASNPAAPEPETEWLDPELKPGAGIGRLKLGATREGAIAVFGRPDRTDSKPDCLDYLSRGVSMRFDEDGRLRTIDCLTREARDAGSGDFKGHVSGPVRMGASRAGIEALFGAPERAIIDAPMAILVYASLGLEFTVKNDRLIRIVLTAPEPASTTKQ